MNPAQRFLTPEQAASYETLRGKLHALYRKDQFRIHERIIEFHDVLKVRYANAREFLLFHLISGSTFPGFNGHFDFPPEDSVERFINREYMEAFPARTAQSIR